MPAADVPGSFCRWGPWHPGGPAQLPSPPSTSGEPCLPAASRVMLTVSPRQRADISAASCLPAPPCRTLTLYTHSPTPWGGEPQAALRPRHGEPPGPLAIIR